MTLYNVHIYREMRLFFPGIDASTPEEAAAKARDLDTTDADAITSCDGETLAALVDVVGDDTYEHSRTIDFEPERLRKAAPDMLQALQACELQLREYVQWHHANAGGCSVEIESAWEQARDAIVQATSTQQPTNERKPIMTRKLPPDPEHMNDDRAAWAASALTAFMRCTGTDPEDALGDLLANLMHWSDRNNYDFDAALDRAPLITTLKPKENEP